MGNTCTGLVTKSWYAQAFSSAFTSSAFPKPAATSQTSPDNNNHELDSAPRDKVQHYPPAPNCIPASVHTNHDPQQVKEVIDVTMTKEGEAIKFPGHDLTASVLHRHTENVKDFYTVGRKLGQGQFGVTDLCAEKSTGKEFACKLIAKRKLISMEDVDDVQHELCIMHHLSGHPNIVTIKGPYEDVTSVHLVMGLCAGGELFDRIIQRGHYSETKAAELTQTIVGVIEACHSLGVMHRDLKPENFLFSNQGEDAALNTTDFGLSIFFKPGEIFTGVVGSPYYVAPEVLQKNMGQKQMCGVQELSSTFNSVEFRHFGLKLSKGFLSRFLKSELDFVSDPWPKIAESAKDLLWRTLNPNAAKRLKAHQVLCHPWICEDAVAPDRPSDSAVQTRLKNFSAMNKLKKMAIRVIAESLSEEEIVGLKEMFKLMDSDDSGSVSFEGLNEGLKKVGSILMEEDICQLMDAADVDQNGTIDYGEFLAATLNLNKIEREENLFKAFSCKIGYLTTDELQQACTDFHMGGYVC